MEISKTEIGNALTSADENHILATANDIYDETQQAYQSEINQSLTEGKQDKLVSGTNIKTVNGISLLGSGDVSISGSDFEYKEIQLSPSNADAIIPRYVNTSNVWAVQSNADVACLFLVHKGDKIKIQANTNYYCVYTLLTTKDIDFTVAPPFVGDWRRTIVNANQEVEFEVPQRCYLYIYNKASAGGNYFPQVANRNAVFTGLSEVALRAGQADKLTVARTINLSEGAIGTATAFDGSKNISIPITKMYESYLVWGGKLITDGMSPLDAASPMFSANRFAFFPTDCIAVEYSNDGGNTWNDYGATAAMKKTFVSPELGFFTFRAGKKTSNATTNDMVRIVFDFPGSGVYFRTDKILLNVNYISSRQSEVYVDIITETYATSTAASVVKTYTYQYVAGWPGWNSIPLGNILVGDCAVNGVVERMSIILKLGHDLSTAPALHGIYVVGNTSYIASNSFAKYGHAYTCDGDMNVTFPAQVKATKLVTNGGTNQQVVLGDGSLEAISELSPITDDDAEILLDNHIHSINVKASGEDVNINIIESTKNGNAWETTEKSLPVPVATQETAGVISAADKQKIDAIDYEDNTLFVGDGMDGMLSIGYESSKASADMRVFHDRYATIHVTSYNDTTGGSFVAIDSMGGKGTVEVNGDQLAELVLSGAGQVRATLTKKNEDGTNIETIIDAAEGITAPKLATIGGTSEQILLGDGTLITFDELKAKLGLI